MKEQRKPLTPRKAKFVKAVLEGKSNTQAAIAATGTKSYTAAGTIGHRMSKDVNIQEALMLEMQKQGIDLPSLVKPIADGLKADKESFDKEGHRHTSADHSIRLKATGMAAQFMGIRSASGDTTINFNNFSGSQRSDYDV